MPKKRRKRLSDQVRDAVARSTKTRYAISQETDIDAGSLCRFVQGKVGLSMDSLDRLADCLGLHIVVDSEANEKGR